MSEPIKAIKTVPFTSGASKITDAAFLLTLSIQELRRLKRAVIVLERSGFYHDEAVTLAVNALRKRKGYEAF